MHGTIESKRVFAPRHPLDRTFFLTCLAIIWLGLAGGFGLDMAHKMAKGTLSYPLIIHVHALVFGAWLLLLTAQIALVERGKVWAHRRLGRIAVVLLPLMVVLGPLAAFTMLRLRPDQPVQNYAFLATQLTNVIGCVTLSTIGLLKRRDAAAHKRLMLMGTIAIMEPGFSRLLGEPLYTLLGDGVWQFWVGDYLGSIVMLLGVGAYDLATRRRLHPAYVGALAFCLALEGLSSWLFYQPWWAAAMKRLVVG